MDGHIHTTKYKSICFVVKFSQHLNDKEMILSNTKCLKTKSLKRHTVKINTKFELIFSPIHMIHMCKYNKYG
jgi:hypothetical protein